MIRKGKGIGFDEFKSRVAELDKFNVVIGWLSSAKYSDGVYIAGVAAVNEHGSSTKGIPPRPFLRPAANDNKDSWKAIVRSAAISILKKGSTAEQALDALGLKVSGDIKKAIVNVTSPALKQSTIESRKRRRADGKTTGNLSKPLIDEGIMINSINYEVWNGN